jgi:deoxyribodipyrimidine photolyase
MTQNKTGIFWFTNDLRLHDQPVLMRAVTVVDELICVYVLSHEWLTSASPQLSAFIETRSRCRAVGTAEQVKETITRLALEFDIDEVMAVTNMYYLADRKRSFELLMGAFKV